MAVLMFTPNSCDPTTAYRVLEEHGFPIGLLPTNVESYSFNTSDGSFVVNLATPCSFQIDSYHLKYNKKLSGKIALNSLYELDGISVKLFFFYLGVNKVLRDGDALVFLVGSFSASFPVADFIEFPAYGFPLSNCVHGPSHSLIHEDL